MIARLLELLGVEFDELDLSSDPRWRAQCVLLANADTARERAERLELEAFAQLEVCAVQAVKPKRKAKPYEVLRSVTVGQRGNAEAPRKRAYRVGS